MRIDLMKERHLKPTLLLCRRVAEVIGLKELWLVEWRSEDPFFGGVEATVDGKHFKMRFGLYGKQTDGAPMFRYDATWDHSAQDVQAHISAPQLMDDTQRRAFAVMVGNRMKELMVEDKSIDLKPEERSTFDDDPDIKIDDVHRHIQRLQKRADN